MRKLAKERNRQDVEPYCQTVKALVEDLIGNKLEIFLESAGVSPAGFRRLRGGDFKLTHSLHSLLVDGLNNLTSAATPATFEKESIKRFLKGSSPPGIDEYLVLNEHQGAFELKWVRGTHYEQSLLRIRAAASEANLPILPLPHESIKVLTDVKGVEGRWKHVPDPDGGQILKWEFTIIYDKNISALRLGEIRRLFLLLFPSSTAVLVNMQPGSTKFTVQMAEADALKVVAYLKRQRIPITVKQDEGVLEDEIPSKAKLILPKAEFPSDEQFYYFMAAHAKPVELRQLGLLLREGFALLWHVLTVPRAGFTTALARFYFVPTLFATQWLALSDPHRRTTTRALLHGFLLWPILIMLFIVGVGLIFVGPGSIHALVWVAVTAVALGTAGSLVCGPLYNSLGVAAGSVCFGLFYACSEMLLAHWFNGRNGMAGLDNLIALSKQADPFVAVVGGIIATAAPVLKSYPSYRIALVLVPPSIAIVASAWLMGNPRTDAPAGPRNVLRTIGFGFLGSFCGVGIGAVAGIYKLLSGPLALNEDLAFWIAAIVAGSAGYCLCVKIRTGNNQKAATLAAAYGSIGALLWALVLITRGTIPGLYLGGLGTAYFHSCWFTLCYSVVFKAGRHAAFVAAALEGLVGFVVFNLIQMR